MSHPREDDAYLQHCLEHAAHYLPAQGPITVFIHHNTLHAFEDLTFDEAVQRGGQLYGCEPYLTEDRYREELRKGRIRAVELETIVQEELGSRANTPILGSITAVDVRQTMLERPIWEASGNELAYHLAESGARETFRVDVPSQARQRLLADTRRWVMRDVRGQATPVTWTSELFGELDLQDIENWSEEIWEVVALRSLWLLVCESLPELIAEPPENHPVNPNVEHLVNEVLTCFTAAFLDQGLSTWSLPSRDEGFWLAFLKLYAQRSGPVESWLTPLAGECRTLLQGHITAIQSLRESLHYFNVTADRWEHFLTQRLLALRGWAGMVREVERRGDRVAHAIPSGSLTRFLAVRILLERLATEYCKTTVNRQSKMNSPPRQNQSDSLGFVLFQLCQLLGLTPLELARATPKQRQSLANEVLAFPGVERRRVFHLAYEQRFRAGCLDAMSHHQPFTALLNRRARFQVVTCLDEREESFRRHIEEVVPEADTFGAAGFFNVVMYYRGSADAHYVPLCPIVLTPSHWVTECIEEEHRTAASKQEKTRKVLGGAARRLNWWSRSFAFGAILSAGLGAFWSIPLVARILFPRLTGQLSRRLGNITKLPNSARLKLLRAAKTPSYSEDGQGFTVGEMAQLAERFLRDIGLVNSIARLVFFLGHGSDSLNNPHKSAYDCGACGGSPGGPNARAIAEIMNREDVRQLIRQNGIAIPEDSYFIGGSHNTCDDSITLFDSDRVPETHKIEFETSMRELAQACDRNAHERSRRFMSAALDNDTTQAHRHVENRSEDLAQVRPELGHATNALCVVARRSRTRGLFLDRRAFLVSYDPTLDDEIGSTLGRLLGAAVPVCGGINLEYYFSHVDSRGYGCGTKLPHNVTGLLGVMDGAASDLRTGLPWQMVEIHEPIRLLFIVETTPEILLQVMNRLPLVDNMIRKGWVQMSVLDPNSGQIQLFQNGEFVPVQPTTTQLPVSRTSADWYRGWRDHLEFAEIQPEAGR